MTTSRAKPSLFPYQRARRLWASACALIALLVGGAVTASAQETRGTDYVFLVDVSFSMTGRAGGADVFPKVKSAINDFVARVDPGSTIFVCPFEGVIREIKKFTIKGPADIGAVQKYVASLVADGNNTAVYNSLSAMLDTVTVYRVRNKKPVMFFVYTDGNDNVSRSWSLQTILDRFRLKRADQDWLFYTELGLPSDAAKAKIFGKQDRMRYLQEQRGDVHPIVQVEPLVRALDFGNIKGAPNARRVAKFRVRGGRPLPAGVTLSADPVFPALRALGVIAQLSPRTFPPSDSLDVELSLLKGEAMVDGEYTGTFRLRASDPLVIVAPNTIEAVFRFEDPHAVTITPTAGTAFPIDFGPQRARRAASEVLERRLDVTFSASAGKSVSGVAFKVIPDLRNPRNAGEPIEVVADTQAAQQGTLRPDVRKVAVRLRVDMDLRPGTYSGTIRFESPDVAISGPGLTRHEGAQDLPWTFTVDARTPWWLLLLLAAAALGVVGFLVWRFARPAVFADLRLELLEPERRDVSLAGLRMASFGMGRSLVPAATASFTLLAARRGRSVLAILRMDAGEVHLTRAGSATETQIIGSEPVFDGDLIRFGGHKARVASVSHVRP